MENIIISVKPEYAKAILTGTKKFEYRKNKINRPIRRAYIHATCPIGGIVGSFEISNIICDTPAQIWALTKAYAYEITNMRVLPEMIKTPERPPQNFKYINKDL